MKKFDVIIIGAGAAGLMCAIEAAKRKRKVLVIDHANKAGKKILMSGGGRCNFTNYHIDYDSYISNNPHFHKSALSSYTQWDFIEMVTKHKVPFHEKTAGQLFCDDKAKDILNLLLTECQQASVTIQLNTAVSKITQLAENGYQLESNMGMLDCQSLVIASGGLSIPTMGASPFGYKIAEQFGINVLPTRAGLVPLTLHVEDKEKLANLAGVSVASQVNSPRQSFQENILFTHRGLSGPAILQISSYWQPGEALNINLIAQHDVEAEFKLAKQKQPQQYLKTFLSKFLPKNLVPILFSVDLLEHTLQEISFKQFSDILQQLNAWQIKPNGTEGYRTAEVTLGGVDCHALSSKTMEVNNVAGLYFIGEVLDVTGWLGGYNFQWAWSSGWVAGQVV